MTRSEAPSEPAFDARAGWEAGYRHRGSAGELPRLDPPDRLTATSRIGHVHLAWDPVEGAVGYLVHRRAVGRGELHPVDHRGGDVLAVPDPWYVDTTGEPGVSYEYAVASLTSADQIDGDPVFDFSAVDAVYDLLRQIGLRPTVEIGFMPRDLASDPSKTVFEYAANISPPKDWQRWRDLVRALVTHLVDRNGLDEVLGWDFEVWNEANLDVFWSGTRDEWLHLYDITTTAVKEVDPRLSVGGPSSAAAGWVDDLLAHTRESGSAVDFVSTHTYGSPPLDLRPTLERYGYSDARLLWTEWGITPTHFNEVSDGTSAGTFLLSGMRSAAGRVDALSYWVASDHFEELGRPPRLLHGGFGLITVGGIAKPRYHALRMLAGLGQTELPVSYDGDGGGGLVQAWASRHDDGRLTILLWNHTLDQDRSEGSPALARTVRLTVAGAVAGDATIARLDREHGDITTLAAELGIGEWPTEDQWEALRAVDSLTPEAVRMDPVDGGAVLELALPQPGAVLVEIPA